jgi:hypothetical protein
MGHTCTGLTAPTGELCLLRRESSYFPGVQDNTEDLCEREMRYSLTILASAILAGCAMSGPTGREILTGSISPNTSRLVIYRSSALGLAVQPSYLVNGQKVGGSAPNGFIVCELPAGRHEVAVDNMPVNLSLFASGKEKVEVNLRPGSTVYLHAQPNPGLTMGVITLIEVTENQGRTDTASMHKIDSNCSTPA